MQKLVCNGRFTCTRHCHTDAKQPRGSHPKDDPGSCHHNDHVGGEYRECALQIYDPSKYLTGADLINYIEREKLENKPVSTLIVINGGVGAYTVNNIRYSNNEDDSIFLELASKFNSKLESKDK